MKLVGPEIAALKEKKNHTSTFGLYSHTCSYFTGRALLCCFGLKWIRRKIKIIVTFSTRTMIVGSNNKKNIDKVKVEIGIFECTGIMGQDLVHPYIQSTAILCDSKVQQ